MLVDILSRAQFGFSIGFHILFPTLNLGLAVFLVIVEVSWLKTGKQVYLDIAKFWTKIFALTFGMGVVSGIVLAYEIGTNFGPFITKFGNVLGALFAYETLTAFFLEAGFLGIMLFGWKRVPPVLHFIATLLVTIGTTISAFWIMSANSWMQTPSGYQFLNGQYVVESWWSVVFNPSFLSRFVHMLFASYVTACFVVIGVGCYFLIKNKMLEFSKKCIKIALTGALIALPIQIVVGDIVGLKIHHYQPLKTAAIEGLWETSKGAAFVLFAWPNQKEQKNHYSLEIPKLASLLNTHDLDGEMLGLNSVPTAEQPPVLSVFLFFRLMVGIGLCLLIFSIVGFILALKKRLYTSRWFHYLGIAAVPLGFIASLSGWLTAELGRQPWVAYKLMLTSEAVSKVGMEQVITSFILLILAYGIVFGFYIHFFLKLIRQKSASAEESLAFQYMRTATEESI